MICVKHISKTYLDGSSKKTIFLNVSYTFQNNGLYFIVGPSGSGKTTLLNLLSGVCKEDDGEIEIDGVSLADVERRRMFSYVVQNFALLDDFNVEENVVLGGKIDGSSATQALKEVGLNGFEKKAIPSLSGGEKQRVAIARALYQKKNMILCDEPTGSLDKENASAIFSILKGLSKEKLIVVSTHDVDAARKYADVILEVRDGALAETRFSTLNNEDAKMDDKHKGQMKRKGLAFSFGARSIKKHPIRFAFATLLFGLSLSSAATAAFIPLSSHDDRFLSVMAKSEEENVAIGKIAPNQSNKYASYESANLTDNEVNEIKDKFGGLAVPIYAGLNQAYFMPDFHGAECTPVYGAASYRQANLPIVYGHVPQGEGEMAITSYMMDAIFKSGFFNCGDPIASSQFKTVDEFLSFSPRYKFAFDNKIYTIVGVAEDSYKHIPTINEDHEAYNASIVRSFQRNYRRTGLHSVVLLDEPALASFSKPDSFTTLLVRAEPFSSQMVYLPNRVLRKDAQNGFAKLNEEDGAVVPFPVVSEIMDFDGACLLKDYSQVRGYDVKSLDLPVLSEKSWKEKFGDTSFFENAATPLTFLAAGNYVEENGLPEGSLLTKLIEYAQIYYDRAFERGYISTKPDMSSEANRELLTVFEINYLASYSVTGGTYISNGGYFESQIGTPSGYEISNRFIEEHFSVAQDKRLNIRFGQRDDVAMSLPISGCYLPKELPQFSSDSDYVDKKEGATPVYFGALALNDADFNELSEAVGPGGNISVIAIKNAKSDGLIKQIQAFTHERRLGYYEYFYINGESMALAYAENNLNSVMAIFLIFGVIFFVLSLIMMGLLLSMTIKDREKDIAVLKINGWSSAEVFFSMGVESVALVGLLLPISLLISLGFGSAFNAWMSYSFFLPMSLWSFLPASFILLFLVFVVLEFATTSLAYRRVAHISLGLVL